MKKLVNLALCYDFDGTLAAGNMQEYGFIKNLGISADDFWNMSAALNKKVISDNVLRYMRLMLEEAKKRNIQVTQEYLFECGKMVVLFDGVRDWFKRINEYALSRDVVVSHYLISSGLEEIVAGTGIADCFKKVYASAYMYDDNGVAIWPARTVNYTEKTQYLYRIKKGCLHIADNRTVNARMPEKDCPVPFSRMIYFGDGDSDVPCMSMIRRSGGHCVVVYEHGKCGAYEQALQYVSDKRANIAAPADYSEGGVIDCYIKKVIDEFATENK